MRTTTRKRDKVKSFERSKNFVVPAAIIVAVEKIDFLPKRKNQALKFISELIDEAIITKISNLWIPFPNTRLEKLLGRSDHKKTIINPLIEAGIIQCNNFSVWHKDGTKGICLDYRINPNLMNFNSEYVIHNSLEEYKAYISSYLTKKQFNKFSSNLDNKLHLIISSFKYKFKVNDKNLTIKNYKTKVKIINKTNNKNIILDDKDVETLGNSVVLNWDDLLRRDMEKVVVDKEKLYKATSKKISSIKIEDFNVNQQIDKKILLNVTYDNYKFQTITLENAIAKAKKNNKSVIQDKGGVYIMDTEEFLNKKKMAMLLYYSASTTNLANGNFYAKRNTTNFRLDTNFTNLSGVLVNEVCKTNNLIQVDINNSQFAIFSYILQVIDGVCDKKDTLLFKRLTMTGVLYDEIQKELGVGNRKQVKQLLFEVSFSAKSQNPLKKELEKKYPTLMKWIADFKKENGSKNFAIMLQKEESKIMIDNVYCKIKEKNLFCLTKHDSVIVFEENLEEVLSIIETSFKEIGFSCRLEYELSNEKQYLLVES